MNIDKKIFEIATGLQVPDKIQFKNIGLSYHQLEGMISFLDNEKFLPAIEENKWITGLFISSSLREQIKRNDIHYILVDDPRLYFYKLYNYYAKARYVKTPSVIDATAQISPFAYVSEYNVVIGKHTVIAPNATILPDVVIGDHCVIQSGTVVGSEGFEYKRTSEGIMSVFHDGKVIIGNHVEIGSNNSIDKGLMSVDTVIGDHTKVDNLIHIAHSVQIGKNCFIVACSMLGGSAIIEDEAWVGPNASITPQIRVGRKGFVTLGSVVTKDVAENEWVTGNFAVPHAKFLEIFKRNLKG